MFPPSSWLKSALRSAFAHQAQARAQAPEHQPAFGLRNKAAREGQRDSLMRCAIEDAR